ncbi:hypothetical protein, partial [Bacillus cereus]|uniref:hypothetical protein n=1 Tax=Bacillus cereus TaxID=1396 RepID=UPI001A7F1009
HYDITVEDIPALVLSPAEFFKGSGIKVNYETYQVTFVGKGKGEARWYCCHGNICYPHPMPH